jgi:hypothetical protein
MRRILAGVLAAALLLAPVAARAQGWGWTPGTAPPSVPPSAIAVRFGTALQPIVDALPANGGTLQLDPGRFYADATDSTIALTLNKPVWIIGQSFSGTVMASPILISSSDCHLENFMVSPTGAAYGVKLFRDENIYAGGGGVARCSLRHIFIGAADSASNVAGRGPQYGLHLDGAILTSVEQSTFAFCSKSGVYLGASQLTSPPAPAPGGWSTNVNVFYNCTANLNGGYGVSIHGGGIEGFQWRGGNIESNDSGAVYCEASTSSGFYGCDFENSSFHFATSLLDVRTSFPFTLEDCNFATTSSTNLRLFLFSSCGQVSVLRNRWTGMPTFSSVGIFDDRCNNTYAWGNTFNTGGFIENRAENHGLEMMTSPFQRSLDHFYGVLWGPQATPATTGAFGGAWTATGPVSILQPTPTTSHLSGWLRRTTFTGTAAAEVGLKQTGAQDFQFWQGDSIGTYGGWYFSATFRLDAVPDPANKSRLFVGLVASGTTAPASVADSSGLNGDCIGLYHDANDVNVMRLVFVKAGVVNKVAFTAGAPLPAGTGPIQYDNSRGYRFQMYAPPNSSVVYCHLYSLDAYSTLCGLATITNGVTKTALMAPQIEMGSAAGTCSLGIANVTVQVAR